jgi:hypothetical protein
MIWVPRLQCRECKMSVDHIDPGDDYIRLHYETVRRYGTISVLARRE